MGAFAYTTVGTVCSSTLLGGLVDLDVLDDQVSGIQSLGIGVGLGVLEQIEEELGRLDGPSCAGDTELLSCREVPSAPDPRTAYPTSICPIPFPTLLFSASAGGVLTLCSTSGSASVSSHGNGLLVVDDILEELLRPLELPAIDGLGGLSGVLERHP